MSETKEQPSDAPTPTATAEIETHEPGFPIQGNGFKVYFDRLREEVRAMIKAEMEPKADK